MNSLFSPIHSYVDFLYRRYPYLYQISGNFDVPELIQQSRFRPLWPAAKKFEQLWFDSLGNVFNVNDDLEDAFHGLFSSLHFVYNEMDRQNPQEILEGMAFILPFLAADIIVPSPRTRIQHDIYYRMYNTGAKDLILQCHDLIPAYYQQTQTSLIATIFGENDAYSITYKIWEVARYVRHLPDYFVEYQGDEDEDEDLEEEDFFDGFREYVDQNQDEDVDVDDDQELIEPFIEPNVLFGEAELRPLLGECCICFEQKIEDYIVTSCRHAACKTCAVRQLRQNASCWFCRAPTSPHTTYLYHGSPRYQELEPGSPDLESTVPVDMF